MTIEKCMQEKYNQSQAISQFSFLICDKPTYFLSPVKVQCQWAMAALLYTYIVNSYYYSELISTPHEFPCYDPI